jgi:hypothetical protein
MRKILKRAGIVLTMVVVLAVLTTSAVMAAQNQNGDLDQFQNQTHDRLHSQDCTCDGVCDGDQIKANTNNAGVYHQNKAQVQAGDLCQTKDGELTQNQEQSQAQYEGELCPNDAVDPIQTKEQTKTCKRLNKPS